jgi:hypothetical protein
MIRAVHPGPNFLPIPDLGSRGQKGTGSRILNRNTGFRYMFDPVWWIRIRIRFWSSGAGKITLTIRKNVKKFLCFKQLVVLI